MIAAVNAQRVALVVISRSEAWAKAPEKKVESPWGTALTATMICGFVWVPLSSQVGQTFQQAVEIDQQCSKVGEDQQPGPDLPSISKVTGRRRRSRFVRWGSRIVYNGVGEWGRVHAVFFSWDWCYMREMWTPVEIRETVRTRPGTAWKKCTHGAGGAYTAVDKTDRR